jgi:hypothetical protein
MLFNCYEELKLQVKENSRASQRARQLLQTLTMYIRTPLRDTPTMDKFRRMNEVLIEANFVYQRAARMYATRYPEEENLPSRQSFRRYVLYQLIIFFYQVFIYKNG